MRFPLLVGIGSGLAVGLLQFFSITRGGGQFGALLYYSPLLVYFAAIYISIKKTRDARPEAFDFKTGLKAGCITAGIAALFLGIGFFVALTHTDIPGLILYLEENGQRDQITSILSSVNRQAMFDRAQFFTIPYFLIGFVVSIAVSLLLRKKQAL